MARIPYFNISQAAPEYNQMLQGRPPLNLYRMLPHAGPAASVGFLKLGGALLREGSLDPKLREIVILRVGMLSDAGYEVYQHKRVARAVGLSEEKIAGLAQGADHPAFDDLERLVIRFTDAVVRDVKAPEALFNAIQSSMDTRMVNELLLTIGFYMMVSRYLENLEVDIETAAEQ